MHNDDKNQQINPPLNHALTNAATTEHQQQRQQQYRQQLRRQIRLARQQLSDNEQQQAAAQLVQQAQNLPELQHAQHIAIYLSNDAELNTMPLIKELWQQGKQLYLPILHLFCPGYLLFQHYNATTPMRPNRFGIDEPVPDVSQLRLLKELDVVLLPLVAFDAQGHRLGMGGGFYDRTLASLQHKAANTQPAKAQPAHANPTGCQANATPKLIGLAHNCQQVATVPTQAWDVPLSLLISPAKIWRF